LKLLHENQQIQREWAMASRWTFTIAPIKKLIRQEVAHDQLWIDPMAGRFSPATVTNDLNPKMPTRYHEDALEFLKRQPSNSFDGVIFDPPYSLNQFKVCYEKLGIKPDPTIFNNVWHYAVKDELARIAKIGGKAICCNWNSVGIGIGRGFEQTRMLVVCHGGCRHDTLITVEVKVRDRTVSGQKKLLSRGGNRIGSGRPKTDWNNILLNNQK
jgi:hypothetical protein